MFLENIRKNNQTIIPVLAIKCVKAIIVGICTFCAVKNKVLIIKYTTVTEIYTQVRVLLRVSVPYRPEKNRKNQSLNLLICFTSKLFCTERYNGILLGCASCGDKSCKHGKSHADKHENYSTLPRKNSLDVGEARERLDNGVDRQTQ